MRRSTTQRRWPRSTSVAAARTRDAGPCWMPAPTPRSASATGAWPRSARSTAISMCCVPTGCIWSTCRSGAWPPTSGAANVAGPWSSTTCRCSASWLPPGARPATPTPRWWPRRPTSSASACTPATTVARPPGPGGRETAARRGGTEHGADEDPGRPGAAAQAAAARQHVDSGPEAARRRPGHPDRSRDAVGPGAARGPFVPGEPEERKVVDFWNQVGAGETRKLSRLIAPDSPLAALTRLYGAAGPLRGIGVPAGHAPVSFTSGHYDRPVAGQRGGTAGELRTHRGQYPYLLLWSQDKLLDEIFPYSAPWHLGRAQMLLKPPTQVPPPRTDLDTVAQLLLGRVAARHGLTFAARALAAWWRLPDPDGLLARFSPRVLAATVDRAIRYWSGAPQTGYSDAAAAFEADPAEMRRATRSCRSSCSSAAPATGEARRSRECGASERAQGQVSEYPSPASPTGTSAIRNRDQCLVDRTGHGCRPGRPTADHRGGGATVLVMDLTNP